MELRREEAGRVARLGGAAAEEQALKLFDRVAEQDEQIAELKARMEKVERRLGQNSQNSSLPPSSDRGQAPKRPARKRSERKQGGQPGHEGAFRGLDDDPDDTIALRPERCRKCGREFTDADPVVGKPWRHQVIELPEKIVVTTEHQLWKVCCPDCTAHTRAELPDDVEPGAFGPRLRATVVMLVVMLMSRRATKTLLVDMFGVTISVGSIENILKIASEALAAPWEAIKQAVQAAEVAHADETSWKRAGQRLWLWGALTATCCCFQIDATRARIAARRCSVTSPGCWSAIATASMTSSTPTAAKSASRTSPGTSRRTPSAPGPLAATAPRSRPRSTRSSAPMPPPAATGRR